MISESDNKVTKYTFYLIFKDKVIYKSLMSQLWGLLMSILYAKLTINSKIIKYHNIGFTERVTLF
jgi:hypothetical protein